MLSDKHAGDSLIVHLIPEGAPIQAPLGWSLRSPFRATWTSPHVSPP
jgi:hypothetical protein